MALTLVTGPANAAKAGVVLDGFREALDRAGSLRLPAPEPLLVVPTAADVEPYQRELALSGGVFGGEVLTFSRLLGLIGRRAGYRGRRLGFVARDRIVQVAVGGCDLRVLAVSACTPGFARAAGRLFSELGQAQITPERFTAGLRRWAGDAGRPDYAEDVAALYAGYARRLEALGRVDAEGFARGALDALRADPARWGGRPVFLYGFDDLTPAQLDVVETLVRTCDADVTLSLTHEPGRPAFAARAATVELLRPLASGVRELGERSEHYAPQARGALHHLERNLFEPSGERVPANGAVRLLEAGGERAEAELIGATLLELVAGGAQPSEMAVMVRAPEQMPLLHQVLSGYGLPVQRAERVAVRATRLGAGLLAYGRAALGGGGADLLTWLRTPGKLPAGEPVDRLERDLRRSQATTARQAVDLIADQRLRAAVGPALDALAGAAAEGSRAFLDVLEAELEAIWTAPHRRAARVLDGEARADARVAAELRSAARELRGLAELAGTPADLLASLAAVTVRLDGGGGGVLLADPLSVRARRFRVVVVCGLQDGVFPQRAAPEPFLDDEDRRGIARATGIALPLLADGLARERFLFYSAVSRAEEVLVLSFRSCDEEGEPEQRSPFVDDVCDLFTEDLWTGRGRRLLAEVVWPAAQAPTPLELRRARVAASERTEARPLAPPPAELFADHAIESARGLEAFAGCGVRWLVERVLKPAPLDPDPEPLTRGSLAHGVLEQTLRDLKLRTGSARLTPATRAAARNALGRAVEAQRPRRPGALGRAGLIALEAELSRWLDFECETGPGYEPEWLEWRFGGDGDRHPPLALDGICVSGAVDRIDVGPQGDALVRDYKASRGFPQATWVPDGHLQAALYALAARELLGLDAAGGLYQPLRGRDLRPRGAAREGAAATGLVDNDVVDPDGWRALLETLRVQTQEAAARLRAGDVRPCPQRCTPRGCAHPGICRAPDAAPAATGAL